jgi:hypothetical protein
MADQPMNHKCLLLLKELAGHHPRMDLRLGHQHYTGSRLRANPRSLLTWNANE